MKTARPRSQSAALLLVCLSAPLSAAQTPPPAPPASPAPAAAQQETVRVFTEEVLVAVGVTDEKGRFDPSLERDELMVLEDGVPQEVRSVRRAPASVLLLLGTAGEMNPAMKTNSTREFAARLVSRLAPGDRVAALQYGGDVETLQDWTADAGAALDAVRVKLSSKSGARLAAALAEAARRFEATPQGNRHLVLVTDGVDESAGGRAALEEAVKGLLAAGVTVHVVSYARMGRRALRRVAPLAQVTPKKTRRTAADIAREILTPNAPPDDKLEVHLTFDLDVQMRRRRAAYERAMREGERWLGAFAEETGGRLLVPPTEGEMLAGAEALAAAIDSQYLVAYRPKRPLAAAEGEEYRRVAVVARRVGLSVSSRRGYVVPTAKSTPPPPSRL